ncbi:prepilin-type N-terminal cleavage/methylation domain-containing protein [Desulfopila sp. IMCC35008]|uniref:prepilin-type N-terminal cleavage/methylation domain-containing protein n=1 Tax=Desulfopila sp. IMCC35008 TaxID=2653858 RepID=UPI0013D88CEB|nr:prepilin-type N-terminal cleavage/methylation domain-containing protein [Desulfopila sp. IMCC35008]
MSRKNSLHNPIVSKHGGQSPGLTSLFHCIRNTCGFTLLEVLIAISIIAIALTSLFSSQSSSLSLAIDAKFNTTAALLAREIVAEYESGIRSYMADEGDFGEEFAGYSWKTEVEEASFEQLELDGGEHPLYKVDLTVSWNESSQSSTFTWFGRELRKDG